MATAEATAESAVTVEQQKPLLEDGPGVDTSHDGGLKRKASDDNPDDGSPKRVRQDDNHEADTEASRRSRSRSRNNRREAPSNNDLERRRLAAQEEKKRGKRLFGGLMSTLSQTSNTSQQQKRRQEIERKQQERMQKQRVEDDQRRAEKLDRLHKVRMAEQITFEEDVMKNKHAKRLSMARYLQTRSEPRIYYLPWKTTPEQEDIIDEQIEDAKASIAREVDQFKIRKQRHIERYGPPARRQRSATPDQPPATTRPDAQSSVQSPERLSEEQQHKPTQEEHDESGDVLEEAEEDMVIY